MKESILLLLVVLQALMISAQPGKVINFNHDWQFVISDESLDQTGMEKIKFEPVSLQFYKSCQVQSVK